MNVIIALNSKIWIIHTCYTEIYISFIYRKNKKKKVSNKKNNSKPASVYI